MKQKTQKELERDLNRILFVSIILTISLFVVVLLGVGSYWDNYKLKTQLSECQEQKRVGNYRNVTDFNVNDYMIKPKLEQQLSECQEQVPKKQIIFELDSCETFDLGDYTKTICSYNNGLFSFTYIFPKMIDEIGYWDRDINESKCSSKWFLWNNGEGRDSTDYKDFDEWKENCEVIE